MNRLRLLALLPMALAVASCGDSTGPANGGCSEPVDIVINAGTTPTFSWSPSCTVGQVWVEDLTETDQDKKLMWSVLAEQNLIKPTVTYGVVPANSIQTQAPRAIQATVGGNPGHTYMLYLSVYGEDGVLAGYALQSFTP
jgi:hypothetical protein